MCTSYEISNGINIPSFGLGTFHLPTDVAEKSVEIALKDGYRLIDTANIYQNEEGVGRGIKKSGVPRKEIFLSTKLWPSVYDDPHAIDNTLKKLQTDYIDLLFLHHPWGNFMGAYKQIEKAYKEGKVKSIGLSNFFDSSLNKVLKEAEIKPHVVQIECHPYWSQHEVIKIIKPFNIKLMAWYPLYSMDKDLINEPVFAKLAKKYGKSVVQIILRWHIQKGNIPIPGSSNEKHIKSNMDIFDFNLTDDEIEEIALLDDTKKYY